MARVAAQHKCNLLNWMGTPTRKDYKNVVIVREELMKGKEDKDETA